MFNPLKVCFAFLLLLLPCAAQTHPVLILTPSVLAKLSAKQQANDPSWTALKGFCDSGLSYSYIKYPDGVVFASGSGGTPIFQGYQGSQYFNWIMSLGLCYQTLAQTNPAAAASYGNLGVQVLLAMTDPNHQSSDVSGSEYSNQAVDSGWAMRTFGTAEAYGYDWFYSLLTSPQRTQVWQQVNLWVDSWRLGSIVPVVSGGQIVSGYVGDKFRPFSSPPACAVISSTGSGAKCHFTVGGSPSSNITSVVIDAPGSGYLATADEPQFTINGTSFANLANGIHPINNYTPPKMQVELLAALGTAPENPNAALYYNDWLSTSWGSVLAPWYKQNLAGGGWPEGMISYGGSVLQEVGEQLRIAKDIKGVDFTSGANAVTFPVDSVDYLLYMSWPGLYEWMDEGSGYCNSVGCGGNSRAAANYIHFQDMYYASALGQYFNHPHAPMLHKFAKDALAAELAHFNTASQTDLEGYNFVDFLYWNPSDPDGDYTTLPLAYKASGQKQVFSRSDWSKNAMWVFFNASKFVEENGQGEQMFGSGQLEVVHGEIPFIVLPMGWNLHLPDGDNGKRSNCNDEVSNCAGNNRPRKFYNTFQVFDYTGAQTTGYNQWSGQSAIPPMPPGEVFPISYPIATQGGVGTNTTQDLIYENTASYTFMTGLHLEAMYRNWGTCPTGPLTGWTRNVLYLRPSNQVLVYDRTSVCAAEASRYDQVLAWHTAGSPSFVASASGTTREDVSYSGSTAGELPVSGFAGSIISLLPVNASVGHGDLDGGGSTWRTEIRNPGCSSSNEGDNSNAAKGACPAAPASQQWLTVLDSNTSAASVYSASVLSPSEGAMSCALLKGSSSSVSCFNNGAPGTTVAGTLAYTIPDVSTLHVLTELPANAAYNVSYSFGATIITPVFGGAYTTTANGVLSFVTPLGSVPVRPAPPTNLSATIH